MLMNQDLMCCLELCNVSCFFFIMYKLVELFRNSTWLEQILILKATNVFLQSSMRLKGLWFQFGGNDLFTLKLSFAFVNIYNHLQG
jgi:hypothetical protein